MISTRGWGLWVHLFSAAVSLIGCHMKLVSLKMNWWKMIVGSIVTRAPFSPMAPAAFDELVIVVDLFEIGAKLSPRVRTGLVSHLFSCTVTWMLKVFAQEILHKIKDQASVPFAQHAHSAEFPRTAAVNIENSIMPGGQSNLLLNEPLSAAPHIASSSPKGGISLPANLEMAEDSTVQQTPLHGIFVDPMTALAPGSTVFQNADSFGHIDEAAKAQISEPPSSKSQSQASSANLWHDSGTSSTPFQQLFAETFAADTWGMDDTSTGELGSMASSNSDVDEDWMRFMQESGLV